MKFAIFQSKKQYIHYITLFVLSDADYLCRSTSVCVLSKGRCIYVTVGYRSLRIMNVNQKYGQIWSEIQKIGALWTCLTYPRVQLLVGVLITWEPLAAAVDGLIWTWYKNHKDSFGLQAVFLCGLQLITLALQLPQTVLSLHQWNVDSFINMDIMYNHYELTSFIFWPYNT